MCQSDDSQHKRYAEEGVQGGVEDVPETEVISSNLKEFGRLVTHEAQRKNVEQSFYGVQISSRVDRVDGARVECQIGNTDYYLHGILVLRHSHAIRIEMIPVVCRSLELVVGESGGIFFILHQPATPEVRDAFLISRRPNHADGMQVNGLFNDIGGFRVFPIDNDGISLEQHILHQIVQILLVFDDVLSDHLTRHGPQFMQIGIPQLEHGLSLEPILANQQAIHHTRSMIVVGTRDFASGFCSCDDCWVDDIAVWFRDALFLQFTWNDRLDLVF